MRNTILLGLFLILHTTAAMAGLGDQLIAHYPLDGDATDASGNGNHGVVEGAVAAADLRGLTAAALEFDGVDDVATVPSIDDWGSELAVSFWVYSSSAGAGQTQILVGSRAAGTGATLLNFMVSIDGDGIMRWFIASFDTSSELYSPQALARDRWVHVVCDWSDLSGTMRISWDGGTVASGPIGGTPRYVAASIGLGRFCAGCGNGASAFVGRLDETRIYSRLLTSGEISTLAGLTAAYPLDGDGPGTDVSGNGRHGTVFGGLPAADRLGAANAARAFDGIDDLVDVPTLGNWGDELGFSFWAYVDSAAAGESSTLIGSRTSGSGATPVNLVINKNSADGLTWQIFSSGTHSVLSTAPAAVKLDRWFHVACDWSQLTGIMRIYLDGALAASGTIGGEPRYLAESIGVGNFGAGFDSTVAPLDGLMDEVRIHNRVLTEDEISDLSAAFFADGFESGSTARWTATVP